MIVLLCYTLYAYRETFLEMWKNKTSSCTYRGLLCICVAGNWSEAANTIVDVVSGKQIVLM